MTENYPSPASGHTKKKSLKILCFGDSLTEGYTNWGMIYKPYSATLRNMLENGLNSPNSDEKKNDDGVRGGTGKDVKEWDIEITTKGVSGQLVRDMEKRMRGLYQPPKLYTHIIFLAGTNDLGHRRPSFDILTDIKSTLSIPLATGTKVLLMTIPECGSRATWLDQNRDVVNEGLKEWAGDNEDIEIFDLHAAIPYHSLSDSEQERLWDDGLHFTEAGYEKIGTLLGERILSILQERPGWYD
ncbi:hypothetical protein HYFRA_00013710 [Hymenoscyphus fraxineus]|uniref:SGNH hydrolase-type esterase domain-containing protein n=1 Tax=Hymenoscyphus fraxineus TaxID=746836 RepID=A0A9N9PZY7_9HELO|nr:hypothetical protein HYFRA_00013710 [Hymenoscyphus fraxineus]